MSTPMTPDDSAERADPAPQQNVAPPQPQQYVAPPQQQYVAPPPQPYPFVPRVREPWINPAKRRTAGLLGAALALVLLAAGFLAGAAVGGGDSRGHHGRTDQGGFRTQPGMYRRGMVPGFIPGTRGPVGTATAVPTPPAPTSSSSHS